MYRLPATGATRLAAFALLLVVIFAGALGLGRLVDLDTGEASGGHGHEAAPDTHAGEAASPALVADGGLRLVVDQTTFSAAAEAPFSFRILTDEGSTLEDYDVVHDQEMHLIVARRDLGGYLHVHPVRAPDGTWRVPLRFHTPGVYRVFADFTTDGRRATLGADVFVPGPFEPEALAPVASTATADGYEVRLGSTAGEHGGETVDFTVLRDGRPVTDIEPYLGAQGHLVALREGDLAFLHVHPPEDGATPGHIAFAAEYPSAGRYRLFLQFKHDGRVHTVAFTREVEA